MAIGEGGGELVKQLLCDTYDVACPDVIAIYLDGKPNPWVGRRTSLWQLSELSSKTAT